MLFNIDEYYSSVYDYCLFGWGRGGEGEFSIGVEGKWSGY